MKITSITYKRVKSLGNYQSEFFEFTAEVNEDQGDLALKVAEQLKFYVLESLGLSEDEPF
jgi:hypothetical protein